jgi:hypothetical protein
MIWRYYNCVKHFAPGRSGTAEHGTVEGKSSTGNACNNPNEPVEEMWYTSAPGFKGVDTVTFPTSGNADTIHVTVH